MFTMDGNLLSKSKQFPHMLHYTHPLSEYVSINMVNYMFVLLLIGFILSLYAKNVHDLKDRFMQMKQIPFIWAISIGILFGTSLIVIASNPSSEFLYFNF